MSVSENINIKPPFDSFWSSDIYTFPTRQNIELLRPFCRNETNKQSHHDRPLRLDHRVLRREQDHGSAEPGAVRAVAFCHNPSAEDVLFSQHHGRVHYFEVPVRIRDHYVSDHSDFQYLRGVWGGQGLDKEHSGVYLGAHRLSYYLHRYA